MHPELPNEMSYTNENRALARALAKFKGLEARPQLRTLHLFSCLLFRSRVGRVILMIFGTTLGSVWMMFATVYLLFLGVIMDALLGLSGCLRGTPAAARRQQVKVTDSRLWRVMEMTQYAKLHDGAADI